MAFTVSYFKRLSDNYSRWLANEVMAGLNQAPVFKVHLFITEI